MSSLNKVTIIGNVGKIPEIRSMQNGKEIASFSVGCSEPYKDKDGNKQSNTQWFNVVIFNENIVRLVSSYVTKGSKIYIEGSLQTREWVKDGVKQYITEVVLQQYKGNIILLSGNSSGVEHNKSKSNGYVDDDIDDEIPL